MAVRPDQEQRRKPAEPISYVCALVKIRQHRQEPKLHAREGIGRLFKPER